MHSFEEIDVWYMAPRAYIQLVHVVKAGKLEIKWNYMTLVMSICKTHPSKGYYALFFVFAFALFFCCGVFLFCLFFW